MSVLICLEKTPKLFIYLISPFFGDHHSNAFVQAPP